MIVRLIPSLKNPISNVIYTMLILKDKLKTWIFSIIKICLYYVCIWKLVCGLDLTTGKLECYSQNLKKFHSDFPWSQSPVLILNLSGLQLDCPTLKNRNKVYDFSIRLHGQTPIANGYVFALFQKRVRMQYIFGWDGCPVKETTHQLYYVDLEGCLSKENNTVKLVVYGFKYNNLILYKIILTIVPYFPKNGVNH